MKVTKQLILLLYALLILIPVSLVFLASFKTTPELYQHVFSLPKAWSLDNYRELFVNEAMTRYFFNSLFVTVVTIVVLLFFSSLISFSVIRLSKKVSWLVFTFFILGMMVPAQVNMIPVYILLDKLGLLDTFQGLILVTIAFLLPTAVFILTGFMRTVPKSIIEAARIDGASEWMIYRKMVLPLSLPGLASVGIFCSVMVWNDLLYPLLLLKSDDVKTLPVALLDFRGEYVTNYPIIFTGVVVASIPMILVFLFLQKYLVKGMTTGSVKG
ncbi:carbohydrate ABC transporter permease [Priestia koreensis]|uniref:carbohydrate ABC transporter permease n=1 Tax=Priestia koreensis TaxID=284581 RepID=UPI003D00C7A7